MSLVDTRTPNEANFFPGEDHDWELVIGLEVHAQVPSEAKLFSGSSTGCGEDRARLECADQQEERVRPEELFLS